MTYDTNNVFARIIRGEIPAHKVFESEDILAFHDISKAAPTHILVIPKGPFKNFVEFTLKENPQKVADFFKKVSEIAIQFGAENSGFRLITNNGSDAHQTVPHFHVHILAGKKMGPLISSDNQLR
jgi:diadenosine tetraphosphate (Ap4A) HIT family hydrolase